MVYPSLCCGNPGCKMGIHHMTPDITGPLSNSSYSNSSTSNGYVSKSFELAGIKCLIKKPDLNHCQLSNYRLI